MVDCLRLIVGCLRLDAVCDLFVCLCLRAAVVSFEWVICLYVSCLLCCEGLFCVSGLLLLLRWVLYLLWGLCCWIYFVFCFYLF